MGCVGVCGRARLCVLAPVVAALLSMTVVPKPSYSWVTVTRLSWGAAGSSWGHLEHFGSNCSSSQSPNYIFTQPELQDNPSRQFKRDWIKMMTDARECSTTLKRKKKREHFEFTLKLFKDFFFEKHIICTYNEQSTVWGLTRDISHQNITIFLIMSLCFQTAIRAQSVHYTPSEVWASFQFKYVVTTQRTEKKTVGKLNMAIDLRT